MARDLVPMLVRILRGCPGTYITLDGIKGIDRELRRDLRTRGTAAFAAAQSRLEEFWRLIADLGVGQVSRDAYEHFHLHKYHRNALCRNTLGWLEQNRAPGFMLGVGEATCSRGTNTKAVALRGTNPSVTVRASHAQPHRPWSRPLRTEPLVPMTKEKKPVSMARMLHSEIVEGILLDKKALNFFFGLGEDEEEEEKEEEDEDELVSWDDVVVSGCGLGSGGLGILPLHVGCHSWFLGSGICRAVFAGCSSLSVPCCL